MNVGGVKKNWALFKSTTFAGLELRNLRGYSNSLGQVSSTYLIITVSGML